MENLEIKDVQLNHHAEPKSKMYPIEPLALLVIFAWNVSNVVIQDQLAFQACVSELGFNISDCLTLGTNNQSNKVQNFEIAVQPYVANLMMVKLLVETMIPAFFSIFIGAWSDKFGRKPMLIACITGYFLSYWTSCILCAVSHFYVLKTWYYILASLPIAISGGMCTFNTGIFCYVADVTTEKDRAAKMSGVEAMLYVGLLFGSLTTACIYEWTNAFFIFGLAGTTTLVSLIYTVFYIEESNQFYLKNLSPSLKMKELFRFDLIRDMLKVCTKERINHERATIWIIMLSLALSVSVEVGNQTVLFLFLRQKFSWTVQNFTFYDSINTMCMICGNIFVLKFVKNKTSISDESFAIYAFVSCLVNTMFLLIASQSWQLFLGVGLTSFKGLVSPMCRSVLAKISLRSQTSGNELGKIYTLTTTLESVMLVGAIFLYPTIYTETLDNFPAKFNVISVIVYSGVIVSLIFVYNFERTSKDGYSRIK